MLTLAAMSEGWLTRLEAAIKADGRAPRAISLAAKLGPNYLSEMLTKGKVPGIDKLLKLCSELNVSAAYIVTGLEVTAKEEEYLTLLGGLSDENISTLLALAHQLKEAGQR